MVPEQDRSHHLNDILTIPERDGLRTGQFTVDCNGVETIDGAVAGRLLGLPRSLVVQFVDGDKALFEALGLMAGGRDWRFGGGQVLTHLPIQLKPAVLNGEWNIHLAGGADWAGWMRHHESLKWVTRLNCHRIWIDMVDVGHLRSVVIGWLLSLRQELGEVPICLVNVDPRANSVLQQMRLGSVFEMDGSDGTGQEDASAARQVMDR